MTRRRIDTGTQRVPVPPDAPDVLVAIPGVGDLTGRLIEKTTLGEAFVDLENGSQRWVPPAWWVLG